MKLRALLASVLLLFPSVALGTQIVGGAVPAGGGIVSFLQGSLPSLGSADTGYLAFVTDGADDSDCGPSGTGSILVFCMWNGTAWEATGDSGSGSGDNLTVDGSGLADGNLADSTQLNVTADGSSPSQITFNIIANTIDEDEIDTDSIFKDELATVGDFNIGETVHVDDSDATKFFARSATQHLALVGAAEKGANTFTGTQDAASWSITTAGVATFISLDDNDGSPLWGINTSGHITGVRFAGLEDENLVGKTSAEDISGIWNFGTADGLEIPNGPVSELTGSPTVGSLFQVDDGANATDCATGSSTTDVLCLYNGSGWAAVAAGGTTAWDSVGDPSGDGSVAMAELDQDLAWDTGNSTAAVFDGLTLSLDYDPTSTDSGAQHVLRVVQINSGADVTGQPEALILLENLDTDSDDAVAAALLIRGTTAVPIAIDLSDAEIVTAIDIGANDIVFSSGTLSSTDLEILDDGSIASSEITDNTITAADIAATVTMADEDFLDFSAALIDAASEGIYLPRQNADSCAASVGEGQICWDDSNDNLWIGDGTAAQQMNLSGIGAFSDSSDPAILNTTTKDVVVGAAQINTAKLTVDGDADQVQFTVQGHSTQSLVTEFIVHETSGGTELYSLDTSGDLEVQSIQDIDGPGTLWQIDINGAATFVSVTTGTSLTPSIVFNDSSSGSEATDASIFVDATDAVGGQEDVDMTFRVQVNSTLTDRIFINADGHTEIQNSNLRLADSLYILEQADADGDVSTYGQLWVDNTTPQLLKFTTEAGVDTTLGVAATVAGTTFEECFVVYAPTAEIQATDDIQSVWRAAAALTITEVFCETDTGTVTMDIQVDSGSTLDVMGTDLVCDVSPGENDSTSLTGSMADGDRLDFLIFAVASNPKRLTLCIEYDFD